MKETVEILLVDDDEAVRGLARVILQHEGWQVAEAGSLLEATDKLREGDFRPQVAVVDLLLPDGLGTDLTQELHRVRRKSKVVYITGDPGWLRRLNSWYKLIPWKGIKRLNLNYNILRLSKSVK